MHRRSVGAIVVASNEFLELAIRDGSAATTLANVATGALRVELDSVFCASNAAVTEQQPAGLGYNAQGVSSTGTTAATIAADVRSMVDAMVTGGVSLRTAFWVLSAEAHSLLAALKVLDANGTTLAGRPVVTDAPSGTFLLVSGDCLFYAMDDQASISVVDDGVVEMSDAPTGDAVTPVAAANSKISLFQDDAVALRATLRVDWSVTGPSDSSGNFGVVKLTGATYA